jgi:hypothetical protein
MAGSTVVTTGVAKREQLAAHERAEKACEEKERNKVAPKRRVVSIEPQRVATMLLANQIDCDLTEARKAIAKAAAKALDRVSDLGQVDIVAMVEAALEVAEEARRVADLIRRYSPNKRGHLSGIGQSSRHA